MLRDTAAAGREATEAKSIRAAIGAGLSDILISWFSVRRREAFGAGTPMTRSHGNEPERGCGAARSLYPEQFPT